MSAELWVNDSGVARQIREVWVNDSGTARRIQEIWVNDSGTARRVYVSDVVAITDVSATSVGTAGIGESATAVYILTSAGDIRYTDGDDTVQDLGDWITPQTNMANYESRVTVTSGTLTTGTEGAWQNLGTTRSWTKSRTVTAGSSSCTFTLEIRRASDAVVVDSATITLTATLTA